MPRSSKTPNVDVSVGMGAAVGAMSAAAKQLRKALAGFDPAALPPGAAADLLYQLRGLSSQLGQLRKPVDEALDPAVKALEEHFVETLSVAEATGVQGAAARVQVTTSAVPTVEDWDKLYAHIARTKSWELLNRAVNREAVRERWDAHKQVPGVGVFNVKRVSCTKLNGRGGAK